MKHPVCLKCGGWLYLDEDACGDQVWGCLQCGKEKLAIKKARKPPLPALSSDEVRNARQLSREKRNRNIYALRQTGWTLKRIGGRYRLTQLTVKRILKMEETREALHGQ